MEMKEMLELHAFFRGRVQRVGFRWTVLDHAEKAGLKGTVKNLPTGEVEVIAQGTQETLDRFLEAIQNDSGSATITSVKKTFGVPAFFFEDFRIVR